MGELNGGVQRASSSLFSPGGKAHRVTATVLVKLLLKRTFGVGIAF